MSEAIKYKEKCPYKKNITVGSLFCLSCEYFSSEDKENKYIVCVHDAGRRTGEGLNHLADNLLKTADIIHDINNPDNKIIKYGPPIDIHSVQNLPIWKHCDSCTIQAWHDVKVTVKDDNKVYKYRCKVCGHGDFSNNDLEIDNNEVKEKQLTGKEYDLLVDAFEKKGELNPLLSSEKNVKDSGKRYVNSNGGQRDGDRDTKFKPKYIPEELIIKLLNTEPSVALSNRGLYFSCRDVENKHSFEKRECDELLINIIYKCIELLSVGKEIVTEEGKQVYTGLETFALFMERCAKKYSFENFKLLNTRKDFEDFKESLHRHAFKNIFNYIDEWHIEAILFNAMCLLIVEFEK